MDQYDIRLRGRTARGKQLVRDYGSVWTVVGTNGPNVLIASPPTEPTYWRILMAVGDPNFDVEPVDAPSHLTPVTDRPEEPPSKSDQRFA